MNKRRQGLRCGDEKGGENMEKCNRTIEAVWAKLSGKIMEAFLKVTRISPWFVLYGLVDHAGAYQDQNVYMLVLAALLWNYLLCRATGLLNKRGDINEAESDHV